MNCIDDDTLICWCETDPSVRFPLVASSAVLFRRPGKKEPHEWTPLTKKLLHKAPDPVAVLQILVDALFPRGGWSGSLATKLESRLKLLDRLDISDIPGVAEQHARARESLKRQIDEERRRETDRDKSRSERFE
jgi:hypothetical protein